MASQTILLPENFDEMSLKRTAAYLESSFLIEKEKLAKALAMIGAKNIEHLLRSIADFFLDDLKIRQLTLDDIERLDFRKLAYEFLYKTGITKPEFDSQEEKMAVTKILFKLGRVYIAEILFPVLVENNSNLAYSVLSLLKRATRSICIAENFDRQKAFDLLLLNQIEILAVPCIQDTPSKVKYKTILAEYIQPVNIHLIDLDRIGKQLCRDYQAIPRGSAFAKLINSKGEDIDPVEVPANKIKLIVHLLYRMYHPYEKSQKRLIAMNKGKAIWNFLQQNLIDESGNLYPRNLRKISSEINNEPGHDQIMTDVKNVLLPVYNRQKK